MAGGHPDLRVHEDGAVQAHVVGAFLDKLLPPGPLHIVFELHPQGAVIPGVGKPAVDFAAGVDKAPAFTEGDDGFHGLLRIFHRDKTSKPSIILPLLLYLSRRVKSRCKSGAGRPEDLQRPCFYAILFGKGRQFPPQRGRESKWAGAPEGRHWL